MSKQVKYALFILSSIFIVAILLTSYLFWSWSGKAIQDFEIEFKVTDDSSPLRLKSSQVITWGSDGWHGDYAMVDIFMTNVPEVLLMRGKESHLFKLYFDGVIGADDTFSLCAKGSREYEKCQQILEGIQHNSVDVGKIIPQIMAIISEDKLGSVYRRKSKHDNSEFVIIGDRINSYSGNFIAYVSSSQ